MRRFRHRNQNRAKSKVKILVIMALTIVLVLFADGQIRPIIKEMAASQAKIIATRSINEAVTAELAKQNVAYEDMVHLSRDSNGTINAIETDIVKMNSLKAAVTTAVQNKMSSVESREIYIPLGNLIGGDFLTGRGPKIPITLMISGSIFTEIESDFTTAGINQTHHRIMMNINTNIYVMIPGYNTATEVPSNFIIAETIIVGEVPDSFTDVEGDQSDTIGKVFDYAKMKE